MEENFINQLGLDDTEAKVYLALLELGPSDVTEITKKAGITRTLGYHVLEKLGWYGLVDRVSGKSKVMVYTAEHPRRLLQHLKNKKNSWEKKAKHVETLLPKLFSLYKIADKPVVRYQQGEQGLKNIYAESLESETEILSIADLEGWDMPEFKKWGQDYNRERGKRKIHERLIILDTQKGRDWMNDYKGSYRYTHVRWIKREQLPGIEDFYGEINVYNGNKIVFITHSPHKMGVVVESRELTRILTALYELAWQVAKVPRKTVKKKKTKKS
jgi:sugar-specific transcriptional regulator TrmB